MAFRQSTVAVWLQMAVLSSVKAECVTLLPLLPNKCKTYFVNFPAVQLVLFRGKWKLLETCRNLKSSLGWVHTCNVTVYRNTVSWQCGRDSWPLNVSKGGYAVTLRACSVCCRYLAVASKGWYGYGLSRCGRATWNVTTVSSSALLFIPDACLEEWCESVVLCGFLSVFVTVIWSGRREVS